MKSFQKCECINYSCRRRASPCNMFLCERPCLLPLTLDASLRAGEEHSFLSNLLPCSRFFQTSCHLILIAPMHLSAYSKQQNKKRIVLCHVLPSMFSGKKYCHVCLQIRSQLGYPHSPGSLKNLSISKSTNFTFFFPGWVFFFCKVRKDKAKKLCTTPRGGKKKWEIDPRVYAAPLQHLPPTSHQSPHEAVEWATLASQLMPILLNLR